MFGVSNLDPQCTIDQWRFKKEERDLNLNIIVMKWLWGQGGSQIRLEDRSGSNIKHPCLASNDVQANVWTASHRLGARR